VNKPLIVICGSARFRDEMMLLALRMKFELYDVIFPPFTKPEVRKLGYFFDNIKEKLEALYVHYLNNADVVFIFNKNGYIGNSVKKEIEYAEKLGKPIIYLENHRNVINKEE